MNSTPTACSEGSAGPSRRRLLGLTLGVLPGWALGQDKAAEAPVDADTLAAIRQGGVAVVLRHALAPGTFDPPGFVLGQCSTQRNLSDEGRAQARRIGAWFQARGLKPRRVRSSQWCRCQDTARLAFGQADEWPALNSLIADRAAESAQTAQLKQALAQLAAGGFEVWVTHQVNITALSGSYTGSGDGVVLRSSGADGSALLVGRWRSP